jgi:hypothetical protein
VFAGILSDGYLSPQNWIVLTKVFRTDSLAGMSGGQALKFSDAQKAFIPSKTGCHKAS